MIALTFYSKQEGKGYFFIYKLLNDWYAHYSDN